MNRWCCIAGRVYQLICQFIELLARPFGLIDRVLVEYYIILLDATIWCSTAELQSLYRERQDLNSRQLTQRQFKS